MEPDALRDGAVKMEGANGLPDVGAQRVPSITLSEDVFGKAFGAKSTVLFLNHFKDEFFHPL